MPCNSRSTVRTMSIDYNVLAIPKGRTVKQVRAKAKRADTKSLKAWRDAAWNLITINGCIEACCADCRCSVFRNREPFGHVHHEVSRRHKATRTDPRNAVIVCRKCHNQRHGREF